MRLPVPKPKPGQDKDQYVGSCIAFLTRENRKRPTQRSSAQIKAICIGTWERHLQRSVILQSQSPIVFKQLGNALLIEGDLLRPGTWVGLDGEPTHYSQKFIQSVSSSIIGQPIRFAHEISSASMLKSLPKGVTVGFWTRYKVADTLKARGYVFDPIAIDYVKHHPHIGLSMEAQVYTEYNPKLGVEDALSGKLTGGALIEDPACPACRVSTVREVSLEETDRKTKKMEGVLNVTGEEEEELEEEEEEEEGGEAFITFVDKKLAQPTRGAFFDWLEKQLKDAGVPENIIGKVMRVVKKAIKSPYPYPKPAAAQKKKQESGEEKDLQAADFWKKIEDKLKAAGVAADVVSKVISALKAEIKIPYPTEALETLTTKLAEALDKIKVLTDERDAEKKAALDKILGEIKALDKDFDVKILENFKCVDTQTTFLQKYLQVLKKHVKPIQLQIGEEKAKDAVAATMKEMFGESATFESVFGLPAKESGGK